MKLRSALLCLLMLAVAVPAFAQGQLMLNHNTCSNVAVPPAKNKNLNCASSTATNVMIASAVAASDVPGVIADLGFIDIEVGSDPTGLPPFWQYNGIGPGFPTGGCAGSARILFSADFTSVFDCADVWGGLGSTGGQWGGKTTPTPDGNRVRLKWTTVVTPDQAFGIPMDTEFYVERITLRQSQLASCPGCSTSVCAVYLSEALSLISGTTYNIEGVDWISYNDPNNQKQCPSPTPAQNKTWGQVKALYR